MPSSSSSPLSSSSSSSSSSSAAAADALPTSSPWLQGNLLLLGVAVLWGSYTPVLKILFNLPQGPTPELVAWIRGVLQLVILGTVVLVSQRVAKASGKETPKRHRTEVFGRQVPTVALGALEIGFYNSCATLLQTEGIATSGAIRASFLIQATALWTPLLSTLFGDRPNNWQWAGSILALCSACIVTLDQQQSVEITGFPETGDMFILAATVVYSMATVRIPSYAKNVAPLELAAGKSSALAVVASMLLLFEFSPLDPEPVEHLVDLWPAYQEQVSAWGGLLWAGVFCGALTAFLHVKGQSMVTATEAQLVFSTVPLWSAVIAAATLPDEHLGPLTCVGALLMVVAGFVSTKK
jgi:drug/metabolite transporter (DMT)-like permease